LTQPSRLAIVPDVAQSTFSSGWPIERSKATAGTRAGAKNAELAIARRMQFLASVPLFAGLAKRQLQALARACETHRWPAGALVVAEGSYDQYCYVVVEGTVDVVRGGNPVTLLGPGEFFGEIALFDPGPRSASVTTATEVVAVGLPRQGFVDVVVKDPQVALRTLGAMARRVRETTEKLDH
jgi:CRP/FNR family transcriptional regulator, cyclic AMP receptor protein